MVVPRVSRETHRRFWVLIKRGVPSEAAAVAVGVSGERGRVWFDDAGGMPPFSLVAPVKHGFRLGVAEREDIMAGIAAGRSIRAIAADLGRAPSTISREIARNRDGARYRPSNRVGRPGTTRYRASVADARAHGRARRPKTAKLTLNQRLRVEVQTRLQNKLSPEQIACRLRIEFPDEPEMWVSHETIYQSIYVQGRGALRRELARNLRTGRALRVPRRRAQARRPRLRDTVNISERPAEADDRAVPGHWEGDLIIGADSASAIGTLVERATRYVMLLHLPQRHGAAEVQEAMITAMSRLPATLRRTLAWDNGSEMANHARIADATGLDIYFCDPHSPWQRGSNENTNGLLRQYFPKSTDLSIFPADYLDYVAAQLNRRPRKTLNWATPAEALDQLLSNPTEPPGVALTS